MFDDPVTGLAPIPYRNNVIMQGVKTPFECLSLQFHIGIM